MTKQQVEEKFAKLRPVDRNRILRAFRMAVFHQASMWEQLTTLEAVMGFEVESADIQTLSAELGDPKQAYCLDIDHIREHLEAVAS